MTLQSNVRQDALILSSLLQIRGVGNHSVFNWLQQAGSPEALWNAPASFWDQVSPAKRALIQKKIDEGFNESWIETYERLGIQVIPYTHPRYPKLLKETHDPPLVLYIRGNLAALEGKNLAVVGTRMASEYGRNVTEKLISELAPAGISIISGLAAGIDTCAHWSALNHQLPTAAVFGSSLDVVFPSNNRRLSEKILAEGGVLISEYPLGTLCSKFTFPQRNRIVAGLSHGVLVVEGSHRSGSLITARLALEEGRTVFAVPGNIYAAGSQGPIRLIKNGAVPVTSGEDILKDMNWLPADEVVSFETTRQQSLLLDTLSEEDRQILELIPYDPTPIETIQAKSGLTSARLGECLTMMELDGLVILLPGANVCRK